MDAMSSAVIDLAEKHLKDFRIRNGQVMAKRCPFCGGGQNNDYETFAIGLNNGLWNCLRGSCKKKKGNFKDLCNYFGETHYEVDNYAQMARMATTKKVYVKPEQNDLHEITEEIITYFGTRKISEQTLKDWKIASDDKGNIVFPFYRDNILTYVKYRKPKKHMKDDKSPKEWQMSNTEPILFGMDMVSFNKPLVICEGEIDALSLYEAGVTNVVSVPCGCNNMEWVNNCYDWVDQFNQIILFGDSDEPGLEMISVLSKRLGEDRCMIPSEYPELIYNGKDYNQICKDANEILMCYGPEGLKAIVDACEPAPVKGILDLSAIPYIDPTTIPRIMTKIPALDHAIGGFAEGGITVISGNAGEGKSTITGSFLLNAVEQGYKVCAYSGELTSQQFLDWIMHQATESKYIGYKFDQRSGKNVTFVSDQIQRRIKDWLSGKFFLYDNNNIMETNQGESVIKMFEICARRYGCKLFLADNLMCMTVSPEEENRAQAKISAQLKAFAAKYKVHVILVAHPRKRKPGETFQNQDISGSSAIGNLADTVLNIERPNIRVAKNRSFGIKDYILCNFDPCNRRIFQANTGDRMVYSWDHNGIELPENPANKLEEFALQDGGTNKEKQPF